MSRAGRLREQLVVVQFNPPTRSIASITRASSTATVTTDVAHEFATNDLVRIAGATPDGYNGKVKITVTGDRLFTFTCGGALTTPATGAPTAVYVSDAGHGRRDYWQTVDSLAGEMLPIRSGQTLAAGAQQPLEEYRFRVRARGDISAGMRLRWTPSWLSGASAKILGITGPPLPIDDGRQWMVINAVVIP